jgi:undecaprenyl-diphosphatase
MLPTMSFDSFLAALFLGFIEGITEYLPVSSTGHLIVFIDLLGFVGPPGKVFEIAIQMGAVSAVCVLYARKLFDTVTGLARDPAARRFAMAVIVAFIPAAILGVLFHDLIKTVLFSASVVATTLILGGIAILIIERLKPSPRIFATEQIGVRTALSIGLMQCLALVPGVSRSGATIMGALVLGVERKAAAEFSFFLAIPTLLGATVYDLWKNRAGLDGDGALLIVTGFLAAFIVAMATVKWLIGFVSRHGFAPFAWYRIAFGALLAVILYLR